MMTPPNMPNDGKSTNDRLRNGLFIVAVIIAALGTLTVVAFEKIQNAVEESGGEWEYEYSYGDVGMMDDITYDNQNDVVDDTFSLEPLVIPEYIGYGGVTAPGEDTTWLRNELDAWWSANPEGLCTSLSPYVSSDHFGYPYSYPRGSALEEEDVQQVVFDYLGVPEENRKYAIDWLTDDIHEDDQILGICKGPRTGIFLPTLVGGERFAVVHQLSVSDSGLLSIGTYQPVGDVMDGYTFIPDNGRGEALIGVGYGDAGFVWWSYYRLNPIDYTSELIETCSGGPDYDEATDDYDYDSWSLECNPEYTL